MKKPLYIKRDVLNDQVIKAFYKALGLDITHNLHVTVCYSKEPMIVPTPDTGKLITMFKGKITHFDENTTVYEFEDPRLTARHKEFTTKYGASYDYDEYRAHVTLSYTGNVDVPPFPGKLILGSEVIEDINEEA